MQPAALSAGLRGAGFGGMIKGSRRIALARAAVLGVAAIACDVGPAAAGDIAQRIPANPRPAAAAPIPAVAARGSVETVYFADRTRAPVRLVRGAADPAIPAVLAVRAVPVVPAELPGHREIVTFGNGRADRVIVVRGNAEPPPQPPPGIRQAALAPQTRIERVSFAEPGQPMVTVVRGGAIRALFPVDLFGPANGGELDRVAFAVHGVESSHGTNPRMWRPEPLGPQGPMQVSAAAALDVGGGNRFDVRENLLLGRAYLAQMYRRYGNWPDALAAYNWGPGNVDRWIAGGRNTDKLPLETVRYLARVLRDALIDGRAAARL